MRVFITGGTGFVGAGIVRELLRGGHDVTALVRSPEAAAGLPAGVSARKGGMADLAVIRAEAAGSDAVIHCAFDHHFGFLDIVGLVLVRLTRAVGMARVAPVARLKLRAIEAIIEGLAASSSPSKVFVCTSPIAVLPSGRMGTEKDSGSPSSFGCFRVASERGARRSGAWGAVRGHPPAALGAWAGRPRLRAQPPRARAQDRRLGVPEGRREPLAGGPSR